MGKVKTVDFSESIAASDLKVSRSSHLIEYMKVMSIKGQGYFLTLGKVMYIQKFKPNFLRNYFANLNQFFYESFPGFVCFVLY